MPNAHKYSDRTSKGLQRSELKSNQSFKKDDNVNLKSSYQSSVPRVTLPPPQRQRGDVSPDREALGRVSFWTEYTEKISDDEHMAALNKLSSTPSSVNEKINKVVIKDIPELTKEYWHSPTPWPKSARYYEPTELVKSSFDNILSAVIPGLENKDDNGGGVTYKDFITKARAVFPEAEVLIVGGLPRDIIYYVAHNENGNSMNEKGADVDIQLTLTQDEIIDVIIAVLKETFPSDFADKSKEEALLERFLVKKNNGYTGFGDRSVGDNLDMFDARQLSLKDRSTADFTFNINYYRYDEHKPMLIGGAGQSLKDAVTKELRPTQNWYAYSEKLMEKPSTIWRYIYFLAGKEGYMDANDHGMTRFSILRALHNTIEAIEKKGHDSYDELLESIALNDKKNPLADDGGIADVRSIDFSTYKFMKKKFNTIPSAMKTLMFLCGIYDDMVAGGSDVPEHFQRDILSLFNIIRIVINERIKSSSDYSEEGSARINEFKNEVDRIGAVIPVATVDNKQGDLGQLYDLMFEIESVIKASSPDDYAAFKRSLDGLLVDQGKEFSVVDLEVEVDAISHCIPQSLRERVKQCLWTLSKNKVAFNYANSVALSDISIPSSLKSKLLLSGLLETDAQRNNARKLSAGALAVTDDDIDKYSVQFIVFMNELEQYDRIGYKVAQAEVDEFLRRLKVASER